MNELMFAEVCAITVCQWQTVALFNVMIDIWLLSYLHVHYQTQWREWTAKPMNIMNKLLKKKSLKLMNLGMILCNDISSIYTVLNTVLQKSQSLRILLNNSIII